MENSSIWKNSSVNAPMTRGTFGTTNPVWNASIPSTLILDHCSVSSVPRVRCSISTQRNALHVLTRIPFSMVSIAHPALSIHNGTMPHSYVRHVSQDPLTTSHASDACAIHKLLLNRLINASHVPCHTISIMRLRHATNVLSTRNSTHKQRNANAPNHYHLKLQRRV